MSCLSFVKVTAFAQSLQIPCDTNALRTELALQMRSCANKMLNLTIGYNPGGNTYTLGNGFMVYLKRIMTGADFQVVMEPKPGASGELASRAVSELDPGAAVCRILIAQSNQLTTNRMGVPNAINPMTDLKPISMLGEAPLVLSVNPKMSKLRNLSDFTNYMRADQGKDRRDFYGSNGNYATDHFFTEVLFQMLGAKATHVPFTGSGPMIQSLISHTGDLEFALLSLGLIRDHLENGNLLALGVANRNGLKIPTKSGGVIEIPAIRTAVPNFEVASIWVALMGGKNMPDSLGKTLTHAARCFAQDEDSRKIIVDQLLFDLSANGSTNFLIHKMKNETEYAERIFKK